MPDEPLSPSTATPPLRPLDQVRQLAIEFKRLE